MALKHVYYHVRNESPVYVRYRIQEAWGWCTGMIQRDDMGGRWEEGSGLGTHVHLWLIHVNVWQNQYSIVKQNKVKIKIKKKKKRSNEKNTSESVPMRWMKLEPIIQSELSQKEKHRYSILTHIYGI